MSNQPKLREPGKRVFEKPKPALTLVKPTQAHKPMTDFSPEVKEMLHEMNRKQRKKDYPDTPDAA